MRWILVKDGLPEKYERVLVTIRRPGKESVVRSSTFYGDGFNNDNGDYWRLKENRIAAWMPLPEPYRARNKGCGY